MTYEFRRGKEPPQNAADPKPNALKMQVQRPSEHQEQAAYIAAIRRLASLGVRGADMIWANANGTPTNVQMGAKMKREGVEKGVPDISIYVARGGYHGALIEMKRVGYVKSDVKPEQLQKHRDLREQGYEVFICGGCAEALRVTADYLGWGEL
jgi:hypothetical protein